MSTPFWQKDAALHAALRKPFESSCKGGECCKLGIERERVVLLQDGHRPLPYDGPVGVRALLEGLATSGGWVAEREAKNILALDRHGARVSIEPGGQVEFSGPPALTVRSLERALLDWQQQVAALPFAERLLWLEVGLNPLYTPDEVHWLPKQRYDLMRRLLPLRGDLGIEMMSLTASTQVSVDYHNEADAQRKYRLAAGLAPLFTAMYANSPIRHGRKSGYVSWRTHIWSRTDPARSGVPELAFASGEQFFDAYIDYALQAPMLFVKQGDSQLADGRDAQGQWRSFAQYLQNSPAKFPESDWRLHLTSLFPEVRLKHYLEIRTPDCNRHELAMSFAALCRALFYRPDAMQAAWELVQSLSYEQRLAAQAGAAALGLSQARCGRFRALDLAGELCEIAAQAIAELDDAAGTDDAHYLQPLFEQVRGKRCSPGEELLRSWDGSWRGDRQALIKFLSSTKPPSSPLTPDKSAA